MHILWFLCFLTTWFVSCKSAALPGINEPRVKRQQWSQNGNADNDRIIFWDDNSNNINPPRFNANQDFNWNNLNIDTTTRRSSQTTVAVPGMGTTRSACEDLCRATVQFDPVCGDNNVTYTNIQWLRCAQRCGRRVDVKYRGACPRVG